IADPRRGAVHRRGRPLGPRGHRRSARRPARHDPEDLRAGAPHRAAAGRGPLSLRTGAGPRAPRAGGGRCRRARAWPGGRAGGGAPVSRAGVTVSADGTVTGNTYDKYGSSNPIVRRLMAGFDAALEELFAQAEPRSLLDVGCGEGVLVHRWAGRL